MLKVGGFWRILLAKQGAQPSHTGRYLAVGGVGEAVADAAAAPVLLAAAVPKVQAAAQRRQATWICDGASPVVWLRLDSG